MNYPEHEKLQKVKDKSQAIGKFLEWLEDSMDYRVCLWDENEDRRGEYFPISESTNKLLSRFFDIDLNKIDQEKREMLAELKNHV